MKGHEKPGPENGLFSCLSFCSRSLRPLARFDLNEFLRGYDFATFGRRRYLNQKFLIFNFV